MGVFLSGTLGFLLSTGGGGDLTFSSSMFSMDLLTDDEVSPVATVVAEEVVALDVLLRCCPMDTDAPTPGGLVRSRFLFSRDFLWAATLPVGRPVSLRISFRESREPKLSLRPAEEEAVLVLLVVLLLLLPVFLMYTFDVVEELPPICSFCCCVVTEVVLELLEFVVVMWLVVLAVLLTFL